MNDFGLKIWDESGFATFDSNAPYLFFLGETEWLSNKGVFSHPMLANANNFFVTGRAKITTRWGLIETPMSGRAFNHFSLEGDTLSWNIPPNEGTNWVNGVLSLQVKLKVFCYE